MKLKQKISLVLVTALVLTVGFAVLVFAEAIYPAQPSETSDRYTQEYEMSTTYNWRYTTNLQGVGIPLEEIGNYSVPKVYGDRDCIVQCNYNTLTAFPTYYKVYQAYTDPIAYTNEFYMTGTGLVCGEYPRDDLSGNLCLGIRNDPRCTATMTNRGCWSPDTP